MILTYCRICGRAIDTFKDEKAVGIRFGREGENRLELTRANRGDEEGGLLCEKCLIQLRNAFLGERVSQQKLIWGTARDVELTVERLSQEGWRVIAGTVTAIHLTCPDANMPGVANAYSIAMEKVA